MAPKVLISVINDLSSDQRVHRSCMALLKMGYEVELIGRKYNDSPVLSQREYQCKRLPLLFRRGPMFYATYNIRLFWYLLFKKSDLLFANDLDTLLPNFLVSKIKRIPLIYDSHELFTELPELIKRPFVKGIWTLIERLIFPRLKNIITVNNSIAEIYKNLYHKEIQIIRNIPIIDPLLTKASKSELGITETDFVVIMQGAGINIQRGAEEALEAMRFVEGIKFLIIGGGDVFEQLKRKRLELKLENKVTIIDKIPYHQLYKYTSAADLGFSLDKDTNLNYRYSLPNKIFDYIHAGTPVLVSNLPELRSLLDEYQVGTTIYDVNPHCLADKLNYILKNKKMVETWKKNLPRAQQELSWDKEEEKYLKFLQGIKS